LSKKIILWHIAALFCIFVWGNSFVSTKILLKTLDAYEILIYRFIFAYIILFLMYPKVKKIKSIKEEMLFLLAGMCGISLYFVFENTSLAYTYASNASFIISASPILAAITAHIITADEKINKSVIYGFFLAITGTFFIMYNGKFFLKLNPLGDLLAFLSAFVWAFFAVLLKIIGGKHNFIYVMRKVFLYGIITSFPFMFLFNSEFDVNKLTNSNVIFNLLFLGLIASSMCYVLWNKSINKIGIVVTVNYMYLVPVVTVISSNLILKERITGLMIFGGFLISLGVFISQKNQKKKVKMAEKLESWKARS